MKKRTYAGIVLVLLLLQAVPLLAQAIPIPSVNIGFGDASKPRDVAVTLETLALITVLTLAPSIVMMVTSFIPCIRGLPVRQQGTLHAEYSPQPGRHGPRDFRDLLYHGSDHEAGQ